MLIVIYINYPLCMLVVINSRIFDYSPKGFAQDIWTLLNTSVHPSFFVYFLSCFCDFTFPVIFHLHESVNEEEKGKTGVVNVDAISVNKVFLSVNKLSGH